MSGNMSHKNYEMLSFPQHCTGIQRIEYLLKVSDSDYLEAIAFCKNNLDRKSNAVESVISHWNFVAASTPASFRKELKKSLIALKYDLIQFKRDTVALLLKEVELLRLEADTLEGELTK